MKSTLIALLVNALLFTALQAANPIYPSTREDLIHLGRHRKFDGVVRLAILTNSGENVDCSAAKVKSNSDFDLYLTAAHCIEESLQSVSVSVGGRLIEAITFFVHPFYMVAKQFDFGVVVFPKDTFKASNVPSYNLCAPNLEELMHSEVFSVGWGAMEGFCSYEVCPRQAMHIPVDRASEYTIENDTLMDRSGVLAQAS